MRADALELGALPNNCNEKGRGILSRVPLDCRLCALPSSATQGEIVPAIPVGVCSFVTELSLIKLIFLALLPHEKNNVKPCFPVQITHLKVYIIHSVLHAYIYTTSVWKSNCIFINDS